MKNQTILVVSDDVKDVKNVKNILSDEFKDIEVSFNQENFIEDFEKYKPRVLVLAFNNVEKAKTYYLGLYKKSQEVHSIPHRTLVLCSKEDLQEVFELCKKEYFNSYMLYWPIGYDSTRLYMEVWHAIRASTNTTGDSFGGRQQLSDNASHIGLLDQANQGKKQLSDNKRPDLNPGSSEKAKPIILVADDDAFQGKVLGKMLKSVDVEVHYALSGFEALGLTKKIKPDLIFMDIVKPGPWVTVAIPTVCANLE